MESALSIFAVIISLTSLIINRTSAQRSQVGLISQIRTEWVKVRPDWTLVAALARGPEDVYTGASADQVSRIMQLDRRMSAGDLEYEEARRQTAELLPASTAVTEFLSFVADLVIHGRVRPDEVYSVLGPEIARHGWTVRWMLGHQQGHWAASLKDDNGNDWGDWTDFARPHQFHDRTQRILFLVDCLWAVLAKRGDHDMHVLMGAAQHKADGGGVRCRRRAIRLCFEAGRYVHAVRMNRVLLEAEFLRPRSIAKERDPLGEGTIIWNKEPNLFLQRGAWRWRAMSTTLQAFRDESLRRD